MAHYIYSENDDDATLQGAEWLQKLLQVSKGPDAEKAFTAKFKALSEEQAANQSSDCAPFLSLFLDHSADLFAAIPENRPEERIEDVQSFFALVLSMLMLLENTEDLDKSTTRLCEIFSANKETQTELRLRLIMMLYNTFNPSFAMRYRVFKHALDYAAKADLFELFLPYLGYLDAWMVDWEPYVQVQDKRALYLDLAKYMRDFGKKTEAFMYLKMYHQTFQGASADDLSKKETEEATVELLKDAISLPNVFQFDDLLQYDTVKAAGKNKQAGLVKVCQVFLSGNVNDLKELQKKDGKVFTEHGLSAEDALSKIRLLTLAAVTQGKSDMSLDDIAAKLEESADNVEETVVRGISEGMVDGRIDQLNRKVLVKSSFQRKFEQDEWTFLDGKLEQWIGNLENVIKFLGEQKTTTALTA
eukprot:gb/GFBE01052852.1/.p1 GENE.gb/GFBE01052852.1/~~gb/GFBE01052852.1/.p1  ORF type:complete len:416 (+),score=142.99 gb/GFBE01052852.1/:1-1248(+)